MFTDHHPSAVSSPPRRRWRFWLLWCGTPAAVLVLACAAYLIRANNALSDAIAEADRLDPRWRWEEIQADRATPPPGRNAADTVAVVQRLKPPRWPGTDMVELFADLQPQHQLNAEQVAALKDRLAEVQPALTEARSLVGLPSGRHAIAYPVDWLNVRLAPIHACREVGGVLLYYDVLDRVQAGEADAAVRSCHAAFNVGASVGDEPNALSQLVRMHVQTFAVSLLERALAQGEPSDSVLAAFQARLEEAEREPLLLYALRGDRALTFRLFDGVRSGTASPTTFGSGPGGPRSVDDVLPRVPGYMAMQESWHLRALTELVEIARMPPEQWTEPVAAWVEKNEAAARAGELPRYAATMLLNGTTMARFAQRNHAVLRCATVAIASERYRRARGRWPTTPDELVAVGLMRTVPGDPFMAGAPVKFVRTADGLIVYTIGPDAKDDGGKLDRQFRATGDFAGFDWGVQVWDVAARRQPPLPPKPVP